MSQYLTFSNSEWSAPILIQIGSCTKNYMKMYLSCPQNSLNSSKTRAPDTSPHCWIRTDSNRSQYCDIQRVWRSDQPEPRGRKSRPTILSSTDDFPELCAVHRSISARYLRQHVRSVFRSLSKMNCLSRLHLTELYGNRGNRSIATDFVNLQKRN